ncbi:MAG TPA: hypothetical protein VEB59_12245 [Gemmatimonadales bacterium]|nr:hypothetical protein [Gemmatimonadales bacterium]
MSESGNFRGRVSVSLLVGSIVPVVVGKYVAPDYMWWLFGLACAMVVAGSAFLVMNSRDESDAP